MFTKLKNGNFLQNQSKLDIPTVEIKYLKKKQTLHAQKYQILLIKANK